MIPCRCGFDSEGGCHHATALAVRLYLAVGVGVWLAKVFLPVGDIGADGRVALLDLCVTALTVSVVAVSPTNQAQFPD